MKHNVVRFRVGGNNSGAYFYEKMIEDGLLDHGSDLITFSTFTPEKKSWHIFGFITYVAYWLNAHVKLWFTDISVAIISPGCMLILPKRVKVICIIHHYDPTPFHGFRQLYAKTAYCLVKLQRSRVDCVVACASVWKRFFQLQNFKTVAVIHNAFQVNEMLRIVKDQDGQAFLRKHRLSPNQYIYIGTYHPAKGQMRTVENLRDLGFTLVATTTDKNTQTDDDNLKVINASFSEYNHLLKNARLAVAMSTFKEGWCRVLHEAAIHGTPILGSGSGGMRELLNLSSVRPSSFGSLKGDVMERLSQSNLSDDTIRKFSGYTSKKFKREWFELILVHLNE
ncbi:hypothetical protein OAI58_09150 [Amylibacter sp.]|nr:hypothetical protein [Amylibacter sp.]